MMRYDYVPARRAPKGHRTVKPDTLGRPPSLFDTPLPFGGETYDKAKDEKRLTGQTLRVFDLLNRHEGEWFVLSEIARLCQCSETSASARLRDLRKDEFGAHIIDRRRHPDNDAINQYRLNDSARHKRVLPGSRLHK